MLVLGVSCEQNVESLMRRMWTHAFDLFVFKIKNRWLWYSIFYKMEQSEDMFYTGSEDEDWRNVGVLRCKESEYDDDVEYELSLITAVGMEDFLEVEICPVM